MSAKTNALKAVAFLAGIVAGVAATTLYVDHKNRSQQAGASNTNASATRVQRKLSLNIGDPNNKGSFASSIINDVDRINRDTAIIEEKLAHVTQFKQSAKYEEWLKAAASSDAAKRAAARQADPDLDSDLRILDEYRNTEEDRNNFRTI